MTPEEAAAAKELARRVVNEPTGYGKLARAVLHFAGQADNADSIVESWGASDRVHKQEIAQLRAERDEAWRIAAMSTAKVKVLSDERNAIKADVARLREACEKTIAAARAIMSGRPGTLRVGEIDMLNVADVSATAALAATAPPESEQGAQPGEAPERGSAG